MKTINTYLFSELPVHVRDRLIQDEQERRYSHELPWARETVDSLLALLKKLPINIKDYSFGLDRSHLRISISDDIGVLSGVRGWTWLQNNLINQLRITRSDYLKNRKDYIRYGYRISTVKPCPFTGYYADEVYLETLQRDVISGSTIKDAIVNLADTCTRLLEEDQKQYTSETEVREWLDDGENYYTREGIRV
jgi:hypothetical protein